MTAELPAAAVRDEELQIKLVLRCGIDVDAEKHCLAFDWPAMSNSITQVDATAMPKQIRQVDAQAVRRPCPFFCVVRCGSAAVRLTDGGQLAKLADGRIVRFDKAGTQVEVLRPGNSGYSYWLDLVTRAKASEGK